MPEIIRHQIDAFFPKEQAENDNEFNLLDKEKIAREFEEKYGLWRISRIIVNQENGTKREIETYLYRMSREMSDSDRQHSINEFTTWAMLLGYRSALGSFVLTTNERNGDDKVFFFFERTIL